MTEYEEFLETKTKKCLEDSNIPKDLYDYYDVKKGLRDRNGKGVVAGLTNISRVEGKKEVDGKIVPCEGRLLYRGYDVTKMIQTAKPGPGLFERAAYLLLFNEWPTEDQLIELRKHVNRRMKLPNSFVREVILHDNGHDVMNTLSRGVLNLALYDPTLADSSPQANLGHIINIIGAIPTMAVYGYCAHHHYGHGEALMIRTPDPHLTIAENILRMLHPDGKYSDLEAVALDRLMVLHMEHGGGNNSTFTARVVSSSGSDTYSVIAAAILSLKGPKHGGASLKVGQMIKDIKKHVKHIADRDEMQAYLEKIADGEAFDGKGLIYGMGHAVYTLSDPRARMLRTFAEKLSVNKDRFNEFKMLALIEELAPKIIMQRHGEKPVCANVDLYSGFVYDMLGMPMELNTPMFAVARTVGWCAHHMEETISSNKIIRPAYVSIVEDQVLPND